MDGEQLSVDNPATRINGYESTPIQTPYRATYSVYQPSRPSYPQEGQQIDNLKILGTLYTSFKIRQ